MPVNINRRGEAQHILLEFPHTERIDVTVKETDIRAIVMDEVYGRILIERPRQEEAEGFSGIELRIIDDERNSRGIFQPPYDISQTGQLKRSADRVIAEERFQPDRIIPAVGTEISGVNTVGDIIPDIGVLFEIRRCRGIRIRRTTQIFPMREIFLRIERIRPQVLLPPLLR